MHIKSPVSSTSPVTTAPNAAKPAPAANKGADFAQMLKTAQAESPTAPAQVPAQG